MDELNELIEEGKIVRKECYVSADRSFIECIAGEKLSKWLYKCKIFIDNYCDNEDIKEQFKNVFAKRSLYISEYENLIGMLNALNESKCITVNKNLNDIVKSRKIFVSHCSKDRPFTDKFVDLLKIIGVKDNQIYYSSYGETGADYFEDCLDRIKTEFEENELMVLFMLSRDFYKSKICLAEMGATWITSFGKYIPIILPPLDYGNIEGVIKFTQNGILLSSDDAKIKLGQLKEKIEEYLCIENKVSSSEWDRARDSFIEKIQELQKNFKEVESKIEDIIVEDMIVENVNLENNCNVIVKINVQNNVKSRMQLEEVRLNIKTKNGEVIKCKNNDWRIKTVAIQPLESVTFFTCFELEEEIKNRDIERKECTICIDAYERN